MKDCHTHTHTHTHTHIYIYIYIPIYIPTYTGYFGYCVYKYKGLFLNMYL